MTALNRVFAKQESTDRWAIPYADFITLLFALFVVLYGSSRIDGQIAGSPVSRLGALHAQANGAFLRPIMGEPDSPSMGLPGWPIGELARANRDRPRRSGVEDVAAPTTLDGANRDVLEVTEIPDAGDQPPPAAALPSLPPDPLLAGPRIDPLLLLERHIRRALPGLLSGGLVELKRTDFGIKIHIQESLLFNVASADLEGGAAHLLEKISGTLISLPYQVRVEGHTDNRPIRTARFPSNWELSSARASRVVRELMNHGLNPDRLAAIGFGEHRPIAANALPRGRRLNRRVSIVVLREPDGEASRVGILGDLDE